jgi:hypothetical protein
MVTLLCECGSGSCQRTFELDADEAVALRRAGTMLIASGCQHGPGLADELLEDRGAFSVWREHEASA